MWRTVRGGLTVATFAGCLCVGIWVADVPAPKHVTAWPIVADLLLVTATGLVDVIVHELGHALAVRLVGGHIIAIDLFGPPARMTFHLGNVPVSIGLKRNGRVRHQPLSVARDSVVAAAGPAANLLSAPLYLLLPIPRWITAYLVLIAVATGLANLAPGDPTADGSTLLQLRTRLRAQAEIRRLLEAQGWSLRPDAADCIINGYALDIPEAVDSLADVANQPDLLLRLGPQPWTLADRPEPDAVKAVHHLSWKLLTIADVPADLADLAASRVEWVLTQISRNKGDPPVKAHLARHTLALARLRQGRTADVRRLCADALAADLKPADRATVLATVAMARHARLLSGQQALAEALALDPDADLVAEAVRVLGDAPASLLGAEPG